MNTIAAVDPNEFRDVFLRGGHKLAERTYGVSNAVLRQLIVRAGGPALLAERAKRQPCGRKAGMR